jgi:hypothetical protein
MALTVLGIAVACVIARELLAAIGAPVAVPARRVLAVADRRPALVAVAVRPLAVAPKTSPPRA